MGYAIKLVISEELLDKLFHKHVITTFIKTIFLHFQGYFDSYQLKSISNL